MSDQISGLESALTDRANKLAAEYLDYARKAREQMLAEARLRLRLDEERETVAAKAHAERIYQQQVQAAELQLRSDLDRLRMLLVNSVLDHLPARLAELAEDETRYLPLLLGWLREAAAAIEDEELMVHVNHRDYRRLQPEWERHAKTAAPGKRLQLAAEVFKCSGGVTVTNMERTIRLDHTFEGRQERLHEALRNIIDERLSPGTQEAQVG